MNTLTTFLARLLLVTLLVTAAPVAKAQESVFDIGYSFFERVAVSVYDLFEGFFEDSVDLIIPLIPEVVVPVPPAPVPVSPAPVTTETTVISTIERIIERFSRGTDRVVTNTVMIEGVTMEYVDEQIRLMRNDFTNDVEEEEREEDDNNPSSGSSGTDVTSASLEDFADVEAITKDTNDLLTWNGTGWSDVATSSLGIEQSTTTVWGSLIGTLADQTDLQTVLDAKLSLTDWYATTTDALAEGSTNLYYTLARFASTLSGTTTDALTEGSTNRYFSNVLTRAALSSAVTGLTYDVGTGVLSLTAGYVIPTSTAQGEWTSAFGWGNHALAGYITDGNTSWSNIYNLFDKDTDDTDDLAEGGTNRFFSGTHTQTYLDTIDKGYFFSTTSTNTWLSTKTTNNLSEGLTNLYFSQVRARSALSAASGISYASSTGIATLDATGAWTGTFDGQQGAYYLDRANHTGSQLASTISDFSTAGRALVSSGATGITYSAGALSATAGYAIPLTASTTNWASFYNTPSSRIAVTTGIDWAGNTLNATTSLGSSNAFVRGGNSFAATAVLGTLDNNALQFSTNALARLSVLANGNVGIGTTTQTTKFAIDSTTLTGSNAFSVTSGAAGATGASTWTNRSAAAANAWRAVTYGNGLFVAVSNSGTNRVMTSPDGITWTARVNPEANSWASVTYGNGLFVAVSTTGTNRVMTSPDGITWTARAATEANFWESVTYGNGLFVAVSQTGTNKVMTSSDGITWTARAAAQANQWIAVTYGNGLFVAVSNSGTNRVMTSPDGITWTARTAAQANSWTSVTYGNGLFVAVSSDGTNRVMTSPDGITWTAQVASAANVWQSVTYGNGLFVAVAQSDATGLMTSPDGITWTGRSVTSNQWFGITYGNGLFVAVAQLGTNRVMTSPITYVTSTLANVDSLGNLSLGTTTAYARLSIDTENLGSNAAFLVGTNALPKLVVSNDGNVGIGKLTPTMALDVVGQSGTVSGASTWTTRPATAAVAWTSVAYGNGLYVAVAFGGNIMSSPDGITWTTRTAPEGNQWNSITYGNGLFVAVAASGTNRVMTSPDGITWTARAASEATSWYGVTYGNGMYVAISYAGTNRVMTSPDGITWTGRAATELSQWAAVTYGNGLFVAVSFDGTNRVMTSPDGITWTARTASEVNAWRTVTYGNGLFVALGQSGTNRVMTSPDGITWTTRVASAANQWQSVTYGNGLFVGVSSDGTNRIMTSPDGITWTARSESELNQWLSVTYGNGLFVAVAQTGTNRVMTSPITAPAVARFANTTGENCTINPALTSLSCSSDSRLKKNITALASSTDSLTKLSSLNAVFYNWNSEEDSHTLHAGFLAQSVQAILPDLVTEDGNGYLALNYAGFAPYLVSGIQQLNERTSFITSSTTASSTISLTTTGEGIGISTDLVTSMLTVAGDAALNGIASAKAFLVPNVPFLSSTTASVSEALPSEVLSENGTQANLFSMGAYAIRGALGLRDENDNTLETILRTEGRISTLEDSEERVASSTDMTGYVRSVRDEPFRIALDMIANRLSFGYKPLANLIAARVTAVQGYFGRVYARELCITDPDGTEECITQAELLELLERLPQQEAPASQPAPSAPEEEIEVPVTPSEPLPEPASEEIPEPEPEVAPEPVEPEPEPEVSVPEAPEPEPQPPVS